MLAMRSDGRHRRRLENRYRQQAGSYRLGGGFKISVWIPSPDHRPR
ncbi:hypothetical protein UCMB321_1655 [Pseudomonas batumici]|uniref:Uncharacterized protein n=1 Tax=Pseudomonas batumici TaxID=226910 RepID=A0A0C2EEM1_9PSED|nr:hypothetical protein UCMB321_1655 [Pseudomonas batumici]